VTAEGGRRKKKRRRILVCENVLHIGMEREYTCNGGNTSRPLENRGDRRETVRAGERGKRDKDRGGRRKKGTRILDCEAVWGKRTMAWKGMIKRKRGM
jgi:hypothetical protein